MKISQVCNRNVVTTVPRASIADVARLMREHHVGSVVVIDPPGSGIPVGLVTDRDIVVEAVAADIDPRTLSAGEIMSGDLATAAEGDEAAASLKTMRERGIRRLPVVDASGQLVGIVTLDDLLEPASVILSGAVRAIGTERAVEELRRTTPA
jgi:CBS domain-containing protein